MTITSRTAPAVLRHRLRHLPVVAPEPVVLVPDRNPGLWCRCGHDRSQHGGYEGPCGATNPDRCSCLGFRYGRRSDWHTILRRYL